MNLSEAILANWKLLLSFFKKEWKFSDFPIRIRKQAPSEKFQFPPYCAQILNWWISGLGNTRKEAVQNLKENFEKYCQENKIPRPGAKVPIQFAETKRIESHGEFAYEFMRKVFEFEDNEGLFISDESSLFDFDGLMEKGTPEEKIKEIYGVDVSNIEGRKICKILDLIIEKTAV